MRIPNICLLILILPSRSSFRYQPTTILFMNLQNLSSVIVFNDCPSLLINHHVVLVFISVK